MPLIKVATWTLALILWLVAAGYGCTRGAENLQDAWAAEKIKAAVKAERLSAKAYLRLGEIFVRKNDYQRAKIAYEQVLKMSGADEEDKGATHEFLPLLQYLLQLQQ